MFSDITKLLLIVFCGLSFSNISFGGEVDNLRRDWRNQRQALVELKDKLQTARARKKFETATDAIYAYIAFTSVNYSRAKIAKIGVSDEEWNEMSRKQKAGHMSKLVGHMSAAAVAGLIGVLEAGSVFFRTVDADFIDGNREIDKLIYAVETAERELELLELQLGGSAVEESQAEESAD